MSPTNLLLLLSRDNTQTDKNHTIQHNRDEKYH